MTINNVLSVKDLEENGLSYKGKLKKYIGKIGSGNDIKMKDVVGYKKEKDNWFVFITNEDGAVTTERFCESEMEAQEEILRIAKYEDFVNIRNGLNEGLLV